MAGEGEILVILDCDGVIKPEIGSWTALHEIFGTSEKQSILFGKYISNDITFREWTERTVRLWEGQDVDLLHEVANTIPLVGGLDKTVDELHRIGASVGIVSGGVEQVICQSMNSIEFEFIVANKLLSDNGRLTGEVEIQVTDENKGRWYQKLMETLSIPPSNVAIVGDSEHDLIKPDSESLCIAFNPVNKEARSAGDLAINSSDLMTILPYISEWRDSIFQEK